MDGGGVVAVGRAEIDTRAPFKSVKEAVALFGEKVLAGELLHAGRRINTQNRVTAPRPALNQYQPTGCVVANVAVVPPPPPPRHITVPATRELDAAKNELEKEREEKHKMAGCILSLQEELSSAMRELKKLKARDEEAQAKVIVDLQVEDLKFMEMNNQKQQQRSQSTAASSGDVDMAAKHAGAAAAEFQKKRYVTFADPPTAAYDRAPSPPRDVLMELHHPQPQQYVASGRPQYREVRFQRQVSAGHQTVKKVMAAAAEEEGTKKKKKPLMPLVSALFMRKKKSSSGHHDDGSSPVKPRPSF